MIPLFARFFCSLLALRYRVSINHADLLEDNRPLLILPNHQALVDPQILLAQVLRRRKVSPVMTDVFFDIAVLRPIFRLLGAVSVSSKEEDTMNNEHKALFRTITAALKAGKTIILYPSGQLSGQGREVIFGKQSAYAVVRELPENVRIIGARVQGLWGSMWSKAWIGRTPPFFKTFGKACLYILANGIFFCPRRRVSITFEDLTENARRKSEGSLKEFNMFLEEFYNVHGEESPLFLKHFFYVPSLKRVLPDRIEGSVADLRNVSQVRSEEIDPAVFRFIQENLMTMHKMEKEEEAAVRISSNLAIDLHLDSLALAEIVMIVKAEHKNASNPPLSSLKTIGDLCLMAQGKLKEEALLPPCNFMEGTYPQDPCRVDAGRSIVNHVIDRCRENPNAPFCYDALQGTMTRKAFLTKASVVSCLIRKLCKGERVGLMLPALSSTSLLVLSTFLAKKTPVMFNWTVGEAAMRHCMESVHIEKIITVRSFFETVKDQIPPAFHDRFLFLEQEAKTLSISEKAWGFLQAAFPRCFFGRGVQEEDAVILFTSGSEALPKAVPLTQRNILTDLQGTLALFPLTQEQIIVSFLPPFHSFGFTITTILPLLSGLRIAYTPNPSDAHAILRMIEHTEPTIIASTPTFLKLLFNAAKGDELHSIRMAVSGAEACTEDVRRMFAEKMHPEAVILEGYGITECSPVVTINPPEGPKAGTVGKFLPHIQSAIRNLQTGREAAAGEQGMIYVRGESIFRGYPDPTLPTPFEKIDGELFYKTGDLGFVDGDKYLTITGRLKRFIKIGGEMISLPFIESLLLQKFGASEEPTLAIEGSDTIDPPKIVLFTTKSLPLEEVNATLRDSGAGNLMKVHEVRMLDTIPVLGTGKIDYKVLKKKIS